MKNRPANAIPFQARFGASLILLAASCLAGRAQGTNAPSRPDYQAFKILTERNIFDPNRSSDPSTRSEPRKTARVEVLALLGTLSDENGNCAIFHRSRHRYRK